MTPFAELKATLLSYCRIDDPSEDDLSQLADFYADAVGTMETAGVREPTADETRRAQYLTCIKALVLDSWDNRGTQQAGTALSDNRSFRRRVNQLKGSEPPLEASDDDT